MRNYLRDIVDAARTMLAMYGRRDIPIVFAGVRPGEKRTEELTFSFEGTGIADFSLLCGAWATSSGEGLKEGIFRQSPLGLG